MKAVFDTGMLTLRTARLGLQLYCPIVTLRRRTLKLSFSTVFVAGGSTHQFDWSVGFQILGFGFGIGKYKESP